MTLSYGQLILNNKYRIEVLLGRGAFTRVYRAMNLELNVLRALKILHRNEPEIGNAELGDYQQRFELEAQLGARLNRPNVNKLYDFVQDEASLILVMEYASGGNLVDRIDRACDSGRPVPIEESVKIALDVAEGLATIHALNAVHRNLKPPNILFNSQGQAQVTDLGLAQIQGAPVMRSLRSRGMPHPGTQIYMSPEQEQSFGDLLPASDVYALGLVLFEILAGRSYKNVTPGTRCQTIRNDVPEWLDDLLACMLLEDPQERPPDGREVVKLLREEGTRVKKRPEEERKRKEVQQETERKSIDEESAQRREAEEKARREAEARLKVEEEARWKSDAEVQRAKSRARKNTLLVLATILILALAMIIYIMVRPRVGKRPQISQPPAREEKVIPFGNLSISSTPTGAEIYLDGAKKGATPLSLEKIPSGKHGIKAIVPGYKTLQMDMEIKANRNNEILFALVPETGETKLPKEAKRMRAVETSKLNLLITTKEETWIGIRADDIESQILLKAEDAHHVKADRYIKLKIGNAGGVDLSLNGRLLPSPGKSGQVVTITLTEKDLTSKN